MIFKSRYKLLLLTALLLGTLSFLFAQTSPSRQTTPDDHTKAKAQSNRAHVWTNDDVVSLRSPADIYEDQKETAAKTNVVGKTSPSASPKNRTPRVTSGPETSTNLLPNDPAVLEALVGKTQDEIGRKQKVLDDAVTDAVRASSELERSTLQSNVEVDKADLNSSKEELKQLQVKLAEVKGQSSSTTEKQDGSPQSKP